MSQHQKKREKTKITETQNFRAYTSIFPNKTSSPPITPRHLFQIKNILKNYEHIHVAGITPFYPYDTTHGTTIDMRKIKEYTGISRTLHAIHIGLGNTCEKIINLEYKDAIPSLINTCIEQTCRFDRQHVFPLQSCFYRDTLERWNILRMGFALCGCSLYIIQTTSSQQIKLPLESSFIYDASAISHELPISLQIPLISHTHHILTSYSCSGCDNIAMGFINTTPAQKTIEHIAFAYYAEKKLYVLPYADARIFIGKTYPIEYEFIDLDFIQKRLIAQYDSITHIFGKKHARYVSEALLSLLNPVFV